MALGAPVVTQSQVTRYDLLIRNGRVLDGSGNPWLAADIGIPRRPHRGAWGASATRRRLASIDAHGLTVSPGFIDAHSHASGGLAGTLKDGRQLLAQGLTTVMLSIPMAADRSTCARSAPDSSSAASASTWRSTCRTDRFAARSSGWRIARRPATELARMTTLARNGMEAGGIGLSSGLYYAPGSYAKTEEVIALARVVGEMGGVYESHIRDEADYSVGVVAAVQEVIRIAEEGHLPGIVAHMKALGPASWGLSMALVERIAQARDSAASRSTPISIRTKRAAPASSAR